jgi:hypothetical protein
MVILRMAKQWNDPNNKDSGGTTWRYFETWQTDVARTESGELVRVEPYVFRQPIDKSKPREVEKMDDPNRFFVPRPVHR